MRYRRSKIAGAVALCAVTVLTGCATQVVGRAVSPLYDPFHVAGLPAVEGPSGPRSDAPRPVGKVAFSDDGPVDALALSAVNDVEEFWSQHYDKPFKGDFRRVRRLVSYDSADRKAPLVCGRRPYQVPNAFFCRAIARSPGTAGCCYRSASGTSARCRWSAWSPTSTDTRCSTWRRPSKPRARRSCANSRPTATPGSHRWVAEGQSTRFQAQYR